MKQLSTLQLIPGMTVAENVFSFQHQLIIAKDTVLTDKIITRLDLCGILFVYVYDTIPSIPPAPIASQSLSYFERIRNSEDFQQFQQNYLLGLDSFRNAMNTVVEKNIQFDADTLLHNALDALINKQGRISILDMLLNMRDYDTSTYAHCMNVALICNVLATWLDFTPEQVELATACGLFHDIGKLLVPHDIITKPGKLSAEEYAQIQKHPMSGYQLLMTQSMDNHIRFAALMHHERYDGTGYPMHLAGDQIDPFARIVAIADVYEAMTAARVYRGPLCPFKVIEIFEAEGFQKYDTKYLLTFLENVVTTYIQNHCLLSDGREGIIIYINKEKLSRPTVKCGGDYVNLAECPDLSIVEIM